MSWAGPGTSAAPTGHPWSWAAVSHMWRLRAPSGCADPTARRGKGEDKWQQAQGKVSWEWSKTSRQHGLASGVWKRTLGRAEIQAKQGDTALNCHRPHCHTCSTYINTRAKSPVVHSSSHTCIGRVSPPRFLPKHTWGLHQSVAHHFYVTDFLWCLFQNSFSSTHLPKQ